ncbi:MAG TPA: peptidoglycan DD-metalloendopeptidase family protein, partial [Mycobacteriales bacterium]|nr:peptidoglycan DD-metalloendopeptidase family protein [Mycobacteriales bacterium]
RSEPEPALHFSGPRFDPLPPSGLSPEPPPADPFLDTGLPSSSALDAEQPESFGFTAPAQFPPAEPERVHTVIRTGRHRAEPGPLGRHRGEQRGERTGVTASMSGRAVFATAIATALTAGGVGAAATLPSDHTDSAAPAHHATQSVNARTVAESIATTPPSPVGTRLAVTVSTPTTARAFSASAAQKTASAPAKPSRQPRRSPSAARPAQPKPNRKAERRTASHRRATTPKHRAAAAATAPAATPAAAAPKWVRPGTGYISSGYGPRWGTVHYGVDLAAPYGAPIYAAGDGVVLRTGPATGFGEAIYIQHANGDVTVYGHEETTLVSPGEHVHAGQLIARVGAEGQATGPHLHFQVNQGSEYGPPINPIPWLAERGVTL